MNMESTRTYYCPKCKNPSVFTSENSYRPFCSHRCKILDLGAWADGLYRVPLTSDLTEEENLEIESSNNSENDDE